MPIATKQEYLFMTAEGLLMYYGRRYERGPLQMYIGESLDQMREVVIPNAHWAHESTPYWVESQAGTLFTFHSDKWWWFKGRQINPRMTIETRRDNKLKQLNLSEYDIIVRHMTMTLTRKTTR